jgi:hypothetical protein
MTSEQAVADVTSSNGSRPDAAMAVSRATRTPTRTDARTQDLARKPREAVAGD